MQFQNKEIREQQLTRYMAIEINGTSKFSMEDDYKWRISGNEF